MYGGEWLGSVSHIIRDEDKENGAAVQDKDQDRVLNHYEYDPVTRQYYLRTRYYNPMIGRFTQEDTYYGDGLNLYEYCRNNTITYKDPTGHNICPTQRDLYHKYKEEGMSPQEACQKMRKELGLDSKSGYKDSGVGNGKDPWKSYESGTDTTRVGRWMSQDEYDKMVASGKVQMSGDNKVHVANPADINAFGKQAPKGSVYVEFDVPSNTISKGGTDGWGIINGPGSLLDRLNAKKGLPRITEMPNVTNISIEGSKEYE